MKNNKTHLYRHFSISGELLYIGISANAFIRTKGHEGCANWFEEIETIKIEEFPTRDAAVKAEKLAIKKEKPKYNIQHLHDNSLDDYIYIRIGKKTKSRLVEQAQKEGSNMTIWVRQLVMRALEEK